MALAKVTIEALTQMANTLRQSADDILATKEQMDNELHSFPWDDPIGLSFINRYEEDFKPLKEKLIPNIENYVQYLNEEGMIVSEYGGENAGGMGIGGAVGAGAMGVGIGIAGAASTTRKGSASAGASEKRVGPPIEQGKQTKNSENSAPLTPVEEMDMDAIYAELTPGQKSAYNKLKKEILDHKEHELFKADISNYNARLDRADRVFSLEGYKAAKIREEVIPETEEKLRELEELAREAVRNNRNQNK